MKSTYLLILFVSIFFLESYAQDQLSSYNRAKTLIGYGNYKEAMDLLRPYFDEKEYGELSKYATYHFSQAAYSNKQLTLAKTTLTPLISERTWDKIDDVHYLMALIHFEEGNNSEALSEILLIKDKDVKSDAENASFNFLKEASVSYLVANIRKYENNNGYVLALKNQLEKQTVMSSNDRNIYNQIKNVNLNENKEKDSKQRNTKKDDVLDIAIILPFNYSGGKGVSNLSEGNFIFELYQGINFAINEAKRKGVKLNVRTFDTERNSAKIKTIFADPFFNNVDLIIGPLYPEETDVVANFAEANQIPFINPLSNVDDKLETYDFAYLFRPSITSISRGFLEYSRKYLDGKRIAIGYSNSIRDEQLAKKIADEASSFGYQVVANQEVNERSVRRFFDDLNFRSGSRTANADIVVILSDDPNVASPTFGLLESIAGSIPVVVMDTWLYFNFANFEMLQNQNFYFISNNTIQFGSSELDEFREDFFSVNQSFPSLNAHLGYELMNWVATTINHSKGFDFRKNLDDSGRVEGKISYGLDFRNSRNNTYVPILKLENGMLEEK
ncbi:ABC transporter substrate-binding protein [Belliella sp. DSM 107340]|uniref:ABC transporter substrate-binding protein n=1 Tax=Belliella calami TaxID=2923436 RepID=A0ABS9USV6_9BACT|nr:ABC transporter substrate-binding protein [Belliella calami]MCH7399519.1 ABC transporter substrate-binding protein [Belliella calami]